MDASVTTDLSVMGL